MNIVLFTNTFTPHVGGVARSVAAFTAEYRRRGHRVLVVAPVFPDMPAFEEDVLRVPALQRFNATDFSVALPYHPGLSQRLDSFDADIVHAQHPFLLGMTALRTARYRRLPMVFTHHTLYERYTHYVPGDSPALKRFAVELATRYANQCDQVFAPSESIREVLLERGVVAPVAVVPTGVCLEHFGHGDGIGWRRQMAIPPEAFVVGHLGRLAPEKNLAFLAEAMSTFLQAQPLAHCLIIGTGPSEPVIRDTFARAGVAQRLHLAGVLERQELADALHAMDLFAFASTSETQGMVLTEAMAAGLPVVALDAPGVREVVRDGINGRLLNAATTSELAAALESTMNLGAARWASLRRAALETAASFSMPRTAEQALSCYQRLQTDAPPREHRRDHDWEDVMAWIKAEWEIVQSLAEAGGHALAGNATDRP